VRTDVLQMQQAHVGVAGDGIADNGHRRQAAAGEDVALDKVHRTFGRRVALLGNGD